MKLALTKAEIADACSMSSASTSARRKKSSSCFSKSCARRWNGEQVKLSGFGNFDLRDKNQRPGRNPKTGEEIPISARRVVTFRPDRS